MKKSSAKKLNLFMYLTLEADKYNGDWEWDGESKYWVVAISQYDALLIVTSDRPESYIKFESSESAFEFSKNCEKEIREFYSL